MRSTHVEDDVLTQFNNHNLWQLYGCSADMCNSFVGGAAVLVTQDGNRRLHAEAKSTVQPSNLSSIHEWSGSFMKTIGNHQIQVGGGWDEVNYTAELRQGTVTFSGCVDRKLLRQPKLARRHNQRLRSARSRASAWPIFCSTIPTRRTSATFFSRSVRAVSEALICRTAGR